MKNVTQANSLCYLNRHLLTYKSAVLFLLIAGALLIAPQAAFAQGTTISSIAFTSDPGADKTYIFGEKVQATVTFSKAVTVTDSQNNGPPELELKFDNTTAKAKYKSGSPGTALVFEYTLQQNDAKNGIAIQANKLSLPTGTVIRDPS